MSEEQQSNQVTASEKTTPTNSTEPTTVTEAGAAIVAAPAEQNHGRLYWFFNNTYSRIKNFAKQHWLLFTILAILLVIMLFTSRGYVYEYVITGRKYFGAVIAATISSIILIWWIKRVNLRARAITLALVALSLWPIYYYGKEVHNYFSLYYRYKTLNIVKLKDLPETAHERIQPLNSVFTMASGQIANNNSPTEPHFVRLGENDYRFTMAAEPSADPTYIWRRLFGGISELYDIPGTKPDVDLSSNESKINVSFETGENLKFGHNVYITTCRAFGLWRYLNYEPDGVVYMKDDAGKWVQVVPLIRWRGIVFPWPEFGGVQIIEQGSDSILNSLKRAFIGSGYYVSPQEIESGKYPFLKGQNICSYKVSRFIAESFKFHNGFMAPLPGFHDNDIRIADMPEDCNPPPFVTYNKMSAVASGASDSLYQYFSLEPFNNNQQGTVAIVFVPADGTPIVYAFFTEENKLSLVGISSVPQLVKNDHPFFDWSSHAPVENRQFTRIINGRKYYFALTTIVTKGEKDNKTFIGGNNPNITLTDLQTRRVFWMRPPESSTWISQLQEQMKFPAGSPLLPPLPGALGPDSMPPTASKPKAE